MPLEQGGGWVIYVVLYEEEYSCRVGIYGMRVSRGMVG